MLSSISNFLGYILNYIYNFVNNYVLAIIIFSILIKIILLPLSIKQQKTMKKSAKMQVEIKEMQDKYKNNPEKLNQEMMDLYKRENMSPLSGCLSSIVQIILLFAVFYLVRSPLTYMKKVDTQTIENYKTQITSQTAYPEVQIIREKGQEDSNVYINMEFLGLDLSSIPNVNFKDYKVYIIPVLYVISSIFSMKLSMNMQDGQKKKEEIEKDKGEEPDPMQSMNKSMSYMMPIMAVSISLVAPLGLALYWLINNILMIAERLILNKFLKEEEET